jgi:hypothetical protein
MLQVRSIMNDSSLGRAPLSRGWAHARQGRTPWLAKINELWQQHFDGHLPARLAVAVTANERGGNFSLTLLSLSPP